MELVAEYRLIDEPRREVLQNLEIRPEWEIFHNSDEHKISVFAGRAMGKSYNLALRAVGSQYDCVIFANNPAAVKVIYEQIIQLSEGFPINRNNYENGRAGITYGNGRFIEVHVLPRNDSQMRGRRFRNQEVMFDEFDHMWFNRFLNYARFELNRARHIVCVGSIHSPSDSPAKRWFQASGTKCFIDAPSVLDEPYYSRRERLPSEQRLMIEQLPPLDYAI